MTPRLLVVVGLLMLNSAHARTRHEGTFSQVMKVANEALTGAPVDGEICFSPDEPCDVKLWKFVQSAQKTVDIAVYDITHPKIVHEILVASKRLTVRIVVDRRQSKGTNSLVSLLVKGGANVRYGKQRGIMHNKFTIVDGKRMETGSYNYTNNASKNNQENQLYTADPQAVRRYHERFEKMWDEATPIGDSLAKG